MFRRPLLPLAFAAVLATSALAFAHDGPRGPRGPVGGLVRSLQAVELTEAQQTDLDALVASLPRPERGEHAKRGPRPEGPPTAEEREARRADRQAKKALLIAQVGSDSPDVDALHTMIDSRPRGAAPAEAHEALDQILAFHATLTPDQRDAWAASLETTMERRKGHRHGHRRGPVGSDTL